MKVKTTFVILFLILALAGFVCSLVFFPWVSVVPAAIAVWLGSVLVKRYAIRRVSLPLNAAVNWSKVVAIALIVLFATTTIGIAILFGWWALLPVMALIGSIMWLLHILGKRMIIAGTALVVAVILFGNFCIYNDTGKFDIHQLSVEQLNVDKVVAGEVEATKVNATDVNATKVNATDVNATKVNVTDVNATKVNATDVNATKVNATDVNATKVNATDVNATKVNATDVNATKVNATDVNATKVNATDVNATKVNATDANATKVNKTKATTTVKSSTTTKATTTVKSTTARKATTTVKSTTARKTTTTMKSSATRKTTTTMKSSATTKVTTTTIAKNPSISVSTDYMQKGDTVIVTLKDATASDVVIKYVDPNTGDWLYDGASLKSISNNQYRLIVDDSLFEMAVDLTLALTNEDNYKMVTLEPCYE